MQNFGPDLMDPPLGGCFSAQEFSFADQSMKKWVGKQHVHKEYLKQIDIFEHERGRRGSPRAHIKSGRSHDLQEPF